MSTLDNNGNCRIISDLPGGFHVQHWDCSDYPDGTITNANTGEVRK